MLSVKLGKNLGVCCVDVDIKILERVASRRFAGKKWGCGRLELVQQR